MILQPFDYQLSAINELREAARTHRRLLLCMLMGAGKTLVSLEIMKACAAKGKRSLFICDRRMLADQAVERAQQQGLDAGIIMARRGTNLKAANQFASKQTVESWLKKGALELGEFNLLIVDEAHRAVSKKWATLFARWPHAKQIGLTATPCLGDGSGMGAYYDHLVLPIQPSGLLRLNRIVPIRAFAPHLPNLDGVRKDDDGDYARASLSQRMNRKNLIADVAGWWKRLAQGRPTIVFACDKAHALAIRDEFTSHGIKAEIIWDETPDEERADIKRRSEEGELPVVVNCDVLCEGIDWPHISCIQLVRPTKRLRRYLQATGRGMRSAPGKTDMLLIDHAGCVLLHGFPDVDRDWPLSAEDNIDKKNEAKPKDSAPLVCSNCSAIFVGTRVCPECGHLNAPERSPEERATRNGTLVEATREELDPEQNRLLMNRYWQTCIAVAVNRSRQARVAAGMFSSKFHMAPWEAKVSHLPEYTDWKRPASEVWPGYLRRRA